MAWFELQSFRAYPLNPEIKPGYPVADCADVWRRHRLWRRWAIGLTLGWIPYGAAVMEGFGRLHRNLHFPFFIIFIFLGLYVAAVVVVGNIAGHIRCPRCGFNFNAWGPWGLGHASKLRCRNCGLRKWKCDPLLGASVTSPTSQEE